MKGDADSWIDQHQRPPGQDSLAEWSKALAPGASPQGRGFEPHSCHSVIMHTGITFAIVKSHHHTKRTCYTLVITRNECPARLGALGAGYFSMLIFARLLDSHCQPCNPSFENWFTHGTHVAKMDRSLGGSNSRP